MKIYSFEKKSQKKLRNFRFFSKKRFSSKNRKMFKKNENFQKKSRFFFKIFFLRDEKIFSHEIFLKGTTPDSGESIGNGFRAFPAILD